MPDSPSVPLASRVCRLETDVKLPVSCAREQHSPSRHGEAAAGPAQHLPRWQLTSSSRLRPQGWRPSPASAAGSAEDSCFSVGPSCPPGPAGLWPGCSSACCPARDRLKVRSTSCRSVRVTPWEDTTSQRRSILTAEEAGTLPKRSHSIEFLTKRSLSMGPFQAKRNTSVPRAQARSASTPNTML